MPSLPRPPPADPHASWPIPKLTVRVDDLAHPGAQLFFQSVSPYEALKEAVIAVYSWLYTIESVPRKSVHLSDSHPGFADVDLACVHAV